MIKIHPFDNEFFISREKNSPNLICSADTSEYLHKDYGWRNNTLNPETGEWNAFFETEEEAQDFLDKYIRTKILSVLLK